jgi:hypothetical protein
LDDKRQISKAGIDEFRQHCQLQASTWKDDWNEKEFTQFIDKVIRKEPLLSAWFSVLYPISRRLPRPSIKLPGDSPNKLRERLAKLKADYHLYSTVLWESFDVVWLAYQKKEAGDERDLDELIKESLQVNHIESQDGAVTTYRVQRRYPVKPDYVDRHISTEYREVEAEHFFGVDPADNKQWSAWADEYLDRFFTWQDALGTDKREKRRIAYLHPERLPADFAEKNLARICVGGWRLCLAWGPKYTPILEDGCLALNRFKSIPRKTPDLETDYPGLYWDVLESKEDEHKDALALFMDSLARLHKCRKKEAIGAFIITTFKNLYTDCVRVDAKKREENLQFISENTPVEGKVESEEDVLTVGDTLAAEVLFSDFCVNFDLDEIFPDEVRNYIARNLEESSTIIAKRFNLTDRRIRQLREEIRQVIRETIEAEHFYGVYLPGPADEIKRAKALIYKKPYYKYTDRHQKEK